MKCMETGKNTQSSKGDDRFVSKAGKHYFTQWDHDKKHREAVTRKLEKIQGLVALLDTWAAQPENTVEYRKYLNNLRQRLHSARTQYKAMAI
ncbi:MAG: hypothetical protein DMF26_08400 [Verrucomicrobia bacterium]|nr:MAG: hypothetical protein DMF26_08400 [Verrucomicrobiota bacterium]